MKANFKTKYGPWAVVTGASSGIGREIAVELAAAGLNLVLVARSQSVLESLGDELQENHGINVKVLPADLADSTTIESIVSDTADLDVGLLVASAGFGTTGKFLESPIADEVSMLHVNCRALMMLSWHFGKRFASKGQGGLILLSSILGFQGAPNAAHYAATKAYVQVLAESLYLELKPQGVDVLASAPGPTQTGFADRADMRMGNAMDVSTVAKETVAALGKRPTVLPGFLSKLLSYGIGTLPRMMRVRVLGNAMHGMTKHQYSG